MPGDAGEERGGRRLAFKHVLIRDVAYEMLPKAARARRHAEVAAFILAGPGEGASAVVAEHFARAVSYSAQAHLPAAEQERASRPARCATGRRPGTPPRRCTPTPRRSGTTAAAAALAGDDEAATQRIAEKTGDIALRLGRVEPAIDAWEQCLEYQGRQGDPVHVAELHRKIGAAFAHKGERKRAIEHHQQGINLIKDRDPSLTLVRLYEDAAWLYVQVGDNMLAIYAAEKALRLAEALGRGARGEPCARDLRPRVRAHRRRREGAREPRARGRARARVRRSRDGARAAGARVTTWSTPRATTTAARARYGEALALAERIGDVPAQIELHAALGQLAFERGEWEEAGAAPRRARSSPNARAWWASSASRTCCAAGCGCTRGDVAAARALFESAGRARRAGRLVGGRGLGA